MKTLKGPGLFLAQFARDTPPHNSLDGIARWAKGYGYKGIQIPTWDSRLFDLERAAQRTRRHPHQLERAIVAIAFRQLGPEPLHRVERFGQTRVALARRRAFALRSVWRRLHTGRFGRCR